MPDFKDWLGHLAILRGASQGSPLTVRLFGIRLVDYFSEDATGMTLNDLHNPLHHTEILSSIRHCMVEHAPCTASLPPFRLKGTHRPLDLVFLPFSENGRDVDHIIGAAYATPHPAS